MASPLPPLFTTSPLYRSAADQTHSNVHPQPHPFFASPLSDENSRGDDLSELVSQVEPRQRQSFTRYPGSSQPSSDYHSVSSSPVFETLSFAKIPIPSSTAVSTDSEAVSSDWQHERRTSGGAQSPSLITTLFAAQPQSNIVKPQQTSSACAPFYAHNDTAASGKQFTKPILRRSTVSTSASEDCRDRDQYPVSHVYGLGIEKMGSSQFPLRIDTNVSANNPAPLKKRSSALTFAVNSPRISSHSTAQAAGNLPGPSRSTSVSPTSSYARTTGRAGQPASFRVPSWSTIRTETDETDEGDGEEDYDDDDENDDEDYMVDSPLPIPGHESDSDEGYQEDEEGGFSSDEDGHADLIDTFVSAPRLRHRPPWAASQWTSSNATNGNSVTTPKRRAATIDAPLMYPTSTDDCVAEASASSILDDHRNSVSASHVPTRGRKTSIAIMPDTKPSSSRCTRHRSPPPPVPSRASTSASVTGAGKVIAPPAARSPSAADLCRRRGSGSTSAQIEPTLFDTAKARGWKSDDSAFFPSSRPSISRAQTNTATFQLRSASTHHAADGPRSNPRKGSLPTPTLGRKCTSILRPPSSIPMQRSSGQPVAKPPAMPPTPPLDYPSQVNTLRRGSAPVISTAENERSGGNGNHKVGEGSMGMGDRGMARSAIGCEGGMSNVGTREGQGRMVRCI